MTKAKLYIRGVYAYRLVLKNVCMNHVLHMLGWIMFKCTYVGSSYSRIYSQKNKPFFSYYLHKQYLLRMRNC